MSKARQHKHITLENNQSKACTEGEGKGAGGAGGGGDGEDIKLFVKTLLPVKTDCIQIFTKKCLYKN